MVSSVLLRFAKASAAGTMVLRGGIVAVNFAVMIGLADLMGLGAFGELAVIWGLALVASTAVSFGGPVLLLRHLTDGGGLHPITLLMQVLVFPAGLAVAAVFVLDAMFPALAWDAILAAGLAINLITCVASIMRALGSVRTSMALRDAGPSVVLAGAAIAASGADASVILLHCAMWLVVLSLLAGLWCLRHPGCADMIKRLHARRGIAWSLWGTTVLGMGLAHVDIIIGGSLLSPEQIGLYAILRRIANLVALPITVATWVSVGPISAAYGANDQAGVRQASAAASQIAFIPGVILFGLALVALPLLHLVIDAPVGLQGPWVFVVLLFGALIQVVFAASFTVATLCGRAHLAAMSRLISILFYVGVVLGIGADFIGPVGNALIYVGATGLGSVLLWQQIRHRLQVDTSAFALLPHQRFR